MGVTIHYRGRLSDVRRLPALCEELADIAASMGWPSTRLDDDWDLPQDARLTGGRSGARIEGNLGLKGVSFTPGPNCETLSFFCSREGNLSDPLTMSLVLDGRFKRDEAWVSVKTQFAGPNVHVWIIGLLKYLKKRHIPDLEVHDEGQYWQTGDIQILKGLMSLIDSKLDEIGRKLSSAQMGDLAGLSAEEIALRIERLINGKDEDKPGT